MIAFHCEFCPAVRQSDDASVPKGWYTLKPPGGRDQHYDKAGCLMAVLQRRAEGLNRIEKPVVIRRGHRVRAASLGQR